MSTPFPIITEYRVFGAEDVIRAQKEIIESFREGELTTKEFSAAVKENAQVSRELNRAYSGLRMETRVQNYEFQQTLHVMQSIGNIGGSLLNIWQAYEVGQIRVERAVRDVTDAQKDVGEAQRVYNQYLQDFGENSIFTQGALDRLTQANKNLKDAQDQAAKAQNDLYIGYATMGLRSVGIAAQVGQLALKIEEMGGAALVAKGALSGLTSVGSITIPVVLTVGVAWALTEYEREILFPKEQPPETLTPQEKAVWETMPVEVRKVLAAPGKMEGITGWLGDVFGGGPKVPGIPGGQGGISYVPEERAYFLHEGERVLTKAQNRLMAGERIISKVLTANVTQYNTITKEADAEKAGERAYRRLLERLGDAW